jgi:hypothetical protein
MKNINAKRLFYLFIGLAGIITGLIFMNAVRANNRKFNQSLLNNIESLYTNHLKNITQHNDKILNKGIILLI